MKCEIIKCSPGNTRKLIESVEQQGGWWVQFGAELLVYTANDRWSRLNRSITDLDANLTRSRQPDVQKGSLHLVEQKGRTFQAQFPDIPVLLDKGRYLVIHAAARSVRAMERHKEPCFAIQPLRENTVVFESLQLSDLRGETDSQISALLTSLQLSELQADLTQLVSYPTRYSTSSFYLAAADWIAAKLESYGLSTSRQDILVGSVGQSQNVIAVHEGTGGAQRSSVLVVAHLDSINHGAGIDAPAPGADDNASGSAGLMAMARVLSRGSFVHDLVFILFGGEEQGLFGSQQYVASLSEQQRSRVLGVLNMDMIGSLNTPTPTVLLEGSQISQTLMDRLANSAARYTGLSVQTSLNPFASDHVSFINHDIPAVLTIEGADSANESIHTMNDTLENVDAGFALEIVRMNVAAVADLAEFDKGGTSPSVPFKGGFDAVEKEQSPGELAVLFDNHLQQLIAQFVRLQQAGLLSENDMAAMQWLMRWSESVQASGFGGNDD